MRVALLSGLMLAGRAARIEAESVPQGTNHREGFDAATVHYTHQGSGFFPMAVVRAVKDSKTGDLFLKNLERFGLVPGERSAQNPDEFPVGIVVNPVKLQITGRTVEMFGFTCAACHTSDLRFNGQTLRVDGGSGLFYVDQLGDQLAASLKATFEDPEELFAFLTRLADSPELDPEVRSKLAPLQQLPKDSVLRRSVVRLLHAKIRSLASTKAFLGSLKKQGAAGANSPENPDLGQRILSRINGQAEQLVHEEAERLLGSIIPHFKVVLDEMNELKGRIAFLKIRGWLAEGPAHRLAGGPGRADDFGTARVELYGNDDARNFLPVNAPVSIPPLWDVDRYAWLHWNANTNSVIQRSIGEAIGVGAPMGQVDVVNQMKIEEQLRKLTPPEWPGFFGAPDPKKVARGGEVYLSHCASCHAPAQLDEKGLVIFPLFKPEAVGTDPNAAVNFSVPVFNGDAPQTSFAEKIAKMLAEQQQQAKAAMSDEERKQMDELEKKQIPVRWRDTGCYAAKPLGGIWSTAPYLHNGSVPTLYHLLRPELRPEKFLIGHNDFDPELVGFETRPEKIQRGGGKELFEFDTTIPGNRNTGHLYGAELSDDDCWALIEYLKVHRDTWPVPQAEYLNKHTEDALVGAQSPRVPEPLYLSSIRSKAE